MTKENLTLLKEAHKEIWEIRQKIKDDEARHRLLDIMDKLYTVIEENSEGAEINSLLLLFYLLPKNGRRFKHGI